MPSPQLAEALDFLHQNAVPLDATVEQRRFILDDRVKKLPQYPGSQAEPVLAGGVPAEWVTMTGTSAARLIFFIHGGGYVAGSAAGSRDLVARLDEAAGARALSIDYRLAPEYPFPAGIADCVGAYRWLLAQGVAPERCAIVGPSAGGGLAAATLLALRDAGDPLPGCGVLICPMADLTVDSPSLNADTGQDVVATVVLRSFARHYLQGADPRLPLASPVFADLSGLPPLLIQAGSAEVLVDDARALAAQARACGVDVVYEEWEGMFHGWHGMAALLSEGAEAIARAGQFIQQHCV